MNLQKKAFILLYTNGLLDKTRTNIYCKITIILILLFLYFPINYGMTGNVQTTPIYNNKDVSKNASIIIFIIFFIVIYYGSEILCNGSKPSTTYL